MSAVILSEPQQRALRALASGPKRTSNRTTGDRVHSDAAWTLVTRGLAQSKNYWNEAEITSAGRAWLAEHDKETT